MMRRVLMLWVLALALALARFWHQRACVANSRRCGRLRAGRGPQWMREQALALVARQQRAVGGIFF